MIDARPRRRVFPVKPVERSCGDCTLCCKVMGVEDPALSKPKDQWCQHARSHRGCAIYETRPDICRSFQCEWLAGNVQEDYSPNRIKGLITKTTDGANWVLHEDPGYEGKARSILKPAIDEWIKDQPERYFIVVCGAKRVFFGKIEKFNALRAAGQAEVANIKSIDEVQHGVPK